MKHAVNKGLTRIASPFDLEQPSLYAHWRDRKRAQDPIDLREFVVEIADPHALSEAEYGAILENVRRHNMAIYRCDPEIRDKSLVSDLGRHFGLERLDSNLCADEDSITSLTVVGEGRHKGYIPYSNRQLNWHTDGYYNTGEDQIRGIILHCVQDAARGGDNALLDHERAYLMIREQDPAMVAALMAPDAMTIPPNVEGGEAIRGAQSGPVFSIDARGNLHMRYTKRKRNIEWKTDTATREAVAFLEELLESDDPYILRVHMAPGEGLICNNVLHSRTGFDDDEDVGRKRLLYRARYYDRIADTDVTVEEE
jgi:alpha-ketoglutarate-dependent taurine dioxygenase